MELRLELASILIDQIKKNPNEVLDGILKNVVERRYVDHDHIHGIMSAADLLQNQINSLEGVKDNELHARLQKRIDGIVSSLEIFSNEMLKTDDVKKNLLEPIAIFKEKYNKMILENISKK